jgi:hypothetical protein
VNSLELHISIIDEQTRWFSTVQSNNALLWERLVAGFALIPSRANNDVVYVASFVVISLKLFSEEASFCDVRNFRGYDPDIFAFSFYLIDCNQS